jgi:hypothetical protein
MSYIGAAPPNGRPYRLLKITEFIKKLPTVTDEQFHAHWKGHHVNIAMKSEAFRKKVRKYNQVSFLLQPSSSFSMKTYPQWYGRNDNSMR